jgi:hypothetical protein
MNQRREWDEERQLRGQGGDQGLLPGPPRGKLDSKLPQRREIDSLEAARQAFQVSLYLLLQRNKEKARLKNSRARAVDTGKHWFSRQREEERKEGMYLHVLQIIYYSHIMVLMR